MKIVVRKIFLNYVALISAAYDELVKSEAGLIFHDMPQDRRTADLDHRLWFQMALFADSRAEPAG